MSPAAPSLRDLVRPALRAAGPYRGPAPALDHRPGEEEPASLNWNESPFGPLPGVREAISAELDRIWRYPEGTAAELREPLARWTGLDADQIVLSHGAQALIGAVAAVFLSPGARVVVPTLTYGLHLRASALAGAEVVSVGTRGLDLDLDRLATVAAERRARLVWLCDPNNPTGLVLDRGGWARLLDSLPTDCVVVADEAYVDYRPRPEQAARVADVRAGRPVVVLRTFSKLFGLAGLRLGYGLVPRELVGAFEAVQDPFNVSRLALAAGRASLADPTAVERRRLEVVAARTRLVEGLAAAGLDPVPSAGNFVLVAVGVDDRALAERLVRRGIRIRAGSDFGLSGHVRITVGPPSLMDHVVDELVAARAAAPPVARARP